MLLWFSNFKTAVKITVLISIAAVFMAGVGYVGYYYNVKLSNDLGKMYKEGLQPVKWLNAARGQARAVEGIIITLTHPGLNKAEEAAQLKEMDALIEETNRLLGDYEKTITTDVEKQEFAVVMETLQKWRQERAKIVELVQAGKKAEAFDYYTKNAATLMDTLNDTLKKLADYNEEKAEKLNKNGEEDAKNAAQGIIGISLVAVLLAIAVGYTISRMITKPLSRMLESVQKVADGDLRVPALSMKSSDEIGQLAVAFDAMTINLRTVVSQVSKAAEHVAASSEELTVSSEQSAQAADQIASSITMVANGADEQLSAANEASAVVEQMSAGIQQVASNTNQVAEQSALAADRAQQGEKTVDKAVNQMTQIEETVNTSARVVGELGERSKEIGQIVDTIAGIASQTNLLALNAAIEAARAGEQGRGFAVVAEEVRKLAEQSQEAAKKIASLIYEIQSETDKAVVAMNEGTNEVRTGAEVVSAAGMAFREIVELVSQTSSQVGEISAAVQEMAGGSQQIVGSVKKIDVLSKKSSEETQSVSAAAEEQLASVEEISSASQTLAKLAQELQEQVSKFHV